MDRGLTRWLIVSLLVLPGATSQADERALFMREAPGRETAPSFARESDEPLGSISLDPLPVHQVSVPEAALYEQIIEQCRSYRRNLSKIGRDASPDGRPQTCRLISFMRRQRWRDAMARRRRLRLAPPVMLLTEPLRARPIQTVSVGAPPAPRTSVVPPPPSSLKPLPLILLVQLMPRLMPPPVWSAPRAKPIVKNE